MLKEEIGARINTRANDPSHRCRRRSTLEFTTKLVTLRMPRSRWPSKSAGNQAKVDFPGSTNKPSIDFQCESYLFKLFNHKVSSPIIHRLPAKSLSERQTAIFLHCEFHARSFACLSPLFLSQPHTHTRRRGNMNCCQCLSVLSPIDNDVTDLVSASARARIHMMCISPHDDDKDDHMPNPSSFSFSLFSSSSPALSRHQQQQS